MTKVKHGTRQSARLASEIIKMRTLAADKRFRPAILYHRLCLSPRDFREIFGTEVKFDQTWASIRGHSNVARIRRKIQDAGHILRPSADTARLDELKSKLLDEGAKCNQCHNKYSQTAISPLKGDPNGRLRSHQEA